jgi:predicted aspartyl protease
MFYRYDHTFDPPAPVLPIRISAPGSDDSVLLWGLVDTGADLCVIPATVVAPAGLPAVSEVRVRGVGGAARPALLYAARLQIDATAAVFLNRLTLLLNGPRPTVQVRRT